MRGRTIAVVSVVATVVVALTVWFTQKDVLVERWWLSRLDSPDRETRLEAARRLAECESTAAVEHLCAPIRRAQSGDLSREQELLVAMGPVALDALLEIFEEGQLFARLRVLEIFQEMGPRAAAAARRIIEVDHEYLFGGVVAALEVMGTEGSRGLLELLRDERPQMRLLAADALERKHPADAPWIRFYVERFSRLNPQERATAYSQIRSRILGGKRSAKSPGQPEPVFRT